MSTVRAKVADDGRKVATLTREDIRDALREYGRLYGNDFSQSAFSPAQAKRNGRPEMVERYYQGRPDGRPWPSLSSIKAKYRTWNEARADIGLPPNTTGPAAGRRSPGTAEPILNVRERLVFVPNEKTKQLSARVTRLKQRLAREVDRRRRLEDRLREAQRAAAETPKVKPVVETKIKTVTKTVKVRDTRSLERAKERLADEQAARRAVADQLASEQRDRNRVSVRLHDSDAALSAVRDELRSAEVERDRARDRAMASEALIERQKAQLAEAREQLMGASEAALVADLVQHAEVRAEQAEVRAARAERLMAEQGAAVTGELRRLTAAELVEFRSSGPAGRSVMEKAIKKLLRALAAGGKEPLAVALDELARAAVTWRDRL